MSLKITTTLSLSSQSIANNTSTVTWKVKYSKSSSTYNNNGAKYYVNVDGNRVKSGTWTPKKGTTSGTIASGTTTIKHNTDGTHAQIRVYAKVYDTGFSPSSADDYSPYLSLPTIKRTYTVSYNANGGSGAPSSQTKTYGVNLTLSSTAPTRAGYAFKGWATSSTGAVAYQAGGTYTANSAVTLYAVWELLGNVRMESYSAIRCDSSGNADDEGTWGKFTCTYILSGQGANEGSVTGRYRASDVSTWTNIANISQSEPHIKAEGVASLSVNVSCLISNLSQDKSYLIELTVTDSYGNTAIASDYISQAYFTMDFLAGGKGIGIGTTASCDESKHPNGLLTCGMDADFKGNVLANKIKDYGFATADIVKLINHLGAGYKRHENVNGSEGTTEIVIDSIKVVFGYSTITPSKALTSTYKTVNFGCTFGGNPDVVLSLFGAPQIATLILSVSDNTTTNFTAHIYASNTTTRGFKFIAIGKAPADERTKNIT